MDNYRNHFTKKTAFSKALIVILVAVLGLAGYTVETEINRVHAETVYAKGWVLCKNYLLIRQWPSRKAPDIGQLDPMDEIEIDGKTKDGFAHIVSPIDGWAWAGNIVFSKPEKLDATAYVTARTRVACRRWIDGPNVESRPYLINGSSVHVYYASDDWACTNRGYIRTEWIEVDYE